VGPPTACTGHGEEDDVSELSGHEELRKGARRYPVIVIVERRVLVQTCVLRLLKRELAKFEIWGAERTADLVRAAGQDVRLVALNIEDRPVTDLSVTADLATIRESFPQAALAVISDRDDEVTAHEAIQCGIQGFFPSTISVDVVIAGFRLVLAGGVYCPPLISPRYDGHHSLGDGLGNRVPQLDGGFGDGAHADENGRLAVLLTPREKSVLSELRLGHSNKVIARNLGLSENTVKMHIQHLMRKLGARTRTEAVFIWSRSATNGGRPAWANS